MTARDTADATPPAGGDRWFLKLYPREWRERYGDELSAMVGDRPLSLGSSIDLIAGAIDARFTEERKMPSILKTGCLTSNDPQSLADGIRGAAVMIGGTVVLSGVGILASKNGFHEAGDFFKGLAFPFSLAMMSHVMYLRKQSAAAKWIITGGTMTFLIVISLLATVFL
jgi:hypothetical protein